MTKKFYKLNGDIMARPLRIEYEGAFYHIMNCGINYQNFFLKETQKMFFRFT